MPNSKLPLSWNILPVPVIPSDLSFPSVANYMDDHQSKMQSKFVPLLKLIGVNWRTLTSLTPSLVYSNSMWRWRQRYQGSLIDSHYKYYNAKRSWIHFYLLYLCQCKNNYRWYLLSYWLLLVDLVIFLWNQFWTYKIAQEWHQMAKSFLDHFWFWDNLLLFRLVSESFRDSYSTLIQNALRMFGLQQSVPRHWKLLTNRQQCRMADPKSYWSEILSSDVWRDVQKFLWELLMIIIMTTIFEYCSATVAFQIPKHF